MYRSFALNIIIFNRLLEFYSDIVIYVFVFIPIAINL